MTGLQTYLPLLGRILISLIFLISGLFKIPAIEGTMGYMEAFGVPGILIWPTIILEVVGGVFLIIGFQTRWTAVALAVFTLIAGLIFHNQFGVQAELTNFLKNLAIVGGLLYVVAFGPGSPAVERR